MVEGRRVVAGEAILSGAATFEQSQVERRDETVEALVREHSRLVYRIAYAVLRRHPDAEDATQETFLRVVRYRAKLASVHDPKTWLARIAWRVAVDRARRAPLKEISLDDEENPPMELAAPDTATDLNMVGAQASTMIAKLIAALPKKLRQPLILSTIEEMSPREVAATLGIKETAVRSRVFRARRILKEKLAAHVRER